MLDHPHILKVFEFYNDSKYFYVITELCNDGDLFNYFIDNESLTE
jgi:calcium-dependent protein kinase